MSRNKDKYENNNTRRQQIFLSPDELASGRKAIWHGVEITGNVRNLSPALWNFTHLTALYLNDNNLSRLPNDIGMLVNLRILDVSSNKLRSLPAELGELIQLRELLLNNNYLRALPYEIGKLFHLNILGLHGNPLGKEFLSIYNEPNGTQRLLTFMLDNLSVNGIKSRAIHRLAPLPTEDSIGHKKSIESEEDSDTEQNTERKRKSTLQSNSNHSQQPLKTSEAIHVPELEPKKKRIKASKGSLITSILFMCLATIVHAEPMIINTPFEHKFGLHFEHIGKIAHVNSEWKIMVYYNLSTFWNEISSFELGINSLKAVCIKTGNNPGCIHISNQFERMQGELRLDSSIFSLKRKRRGALNIIGNMAHSLFGVLDSEYENEMATIIDNVKSNERHLLKLIKNQTSIIDSTINIMKSNQRNIKDKFSEIDEKLKYLINQINKNNSDGFEANLMQAQTIIAFQLLIAYIELQQIQAAITDVLTDTHHGKISPLLLSPQQLVQELREIKTNLPSSIQLPTDETNLLQLYKLMKIRGTLVKNYLVVVIKLPLVDHNSFDLFRVIPIPFNVGDVLMRLKVSTYFAVNALRSSYFTVTENQINSCELPTVGSFVCKDKGLIHHQGSSPASCELSLLLNEEYTPCEAENITTAYSLTQLNEKNKWIYGFGAPVRLQAVCGDHIEQIRMNGSGMLSINSNCVIKHDLFTITGNDMKSSHFNTSFNGTGIVVSFPMDVNQSRPSYLSRYGSYEPSIKQLVSLQKLLPKEDSFKIIEDNLTYHKHFAIPGYVALILIVASLTYLAWTRRFKILKRRSIPVPAPRSTRQPDFSVEVS